MGSFFHIWQHLPSHISPIIFSIGSFALHWYSLMYILALATAYLLTAWRIREGELSVPPDTSSLADVILTSVIGVIVGGRLGYVLVYDLPYYVRHPLEIFLPFSFKGGIHFTGFSGMSFHGGLLGVLIVLWILSHRRGWKILDLMDALVPAVPLGYTFGRLGNFINGELYGRVTHWSLGMYFPLAPTHELRFPSQLFEALFEGIVLFIILWSIRNWRPFRGFLSGAYLMGYGVARFFVEFTRQPDPQLGYVLGPFTMGQVLCAGMIIAAVLLWIVQWKRGAVPAPAPRRAKN